MFGGFKQSFASANIRICNKGNRFPDDTTANIYTAGLLGEQYVGLQPGADDKYLHSGSKIQITSSAMILEDLIGKFMMNKMSSN